MSPTRSLLLFALAPLAGCLWISADDHAQWTDRDGDGTPGAVDCDDADPTVRASYVWYVDDDGDGYGQDPADHEGCEAPAGYATNADDCDDADPEIHPGAEDICDDVDNDCDGHAAGAEDSDNDGWLACEDCDDADGSVHPDAIEDCDGRDGDCDGAIDEVAPSWYGDGDGDGYGFGDPVAVDCEQPDGTSGVNTDCDDSDDTIHPGAEEICGDGVDDDCQDEDAECALSGELELPDAGVAIYSDAAGARMGNALDGAGDLNGDGHLDLILGGIYYSPPGVNSSGGAWVVLGPIEEDLYAEDATLLFSEDEYGFAGTDVAGVGDFDSDGLDDFVVGEPGSSIVWLMTEAPGRESALEEAGEPSFGEGYLGVAVDGGEISDDGYSDLIVGAYSEGSGGRVHLYYGPLFAEWAYDAPAQIYGDSGERFGYDVAVAGDLDGDGDGEVIVGAPYNSDLGKNYAGAAYLISGTVFGVAPNYSGGIATLWGERIGDQIGHTVAGAGDVNGDGYDEFLAGGPSVDANGTDAGALYLSSHIQESQTISDAPVSIIGNPGDLLGGAAAAAGDLNGDGYDDLIIGALGIDDRAYIYYGPLVGALGTDDADATLRTAESNDTLGGAVAGIGDHDADGWPDVMVGAAYTDTSGGNNAGAAYLLFGGPM